VWRQYAENVSESLSKGMRVIVVGRLKQRTWETKEGEKRTVFEVDVDEVGPALRSVTAKTARVERSGDGSGGEGGWSSAPRTRPQTHEDPWAATNTSDEPPF